MTVRILEGDARTSGRVPARSVHLIVTSPPYPMIPQWDVLFEGLGAHDYRSMHAVLDQVWARCRDALVPGGILAVNVGDALRTTDGEFRLWPNHVDVTNGCLSAGLRPLPYLLWKKPTNRPNAFLGSGFLPPNAYVTIDCEFVLLFRNGGLRRFPRADASRSESRYTKAERDHWFSQVWDDVRGARQAAGTGRTGAFPPEIPARLIRMFSCVGETVLDPFAGTGTTLWEADRLGREAIGIELDPQLVAQLRERVASLRPAVSGERPPTPGAGAPPQSRAGGTGARSR